MAWIDRLSWPVLIIAGVFLAVAPLGAEPHLIEKLRLLGEGMLLKPLDIFDLLMHSAPLVLIGLKAYRQLRTGNR